jgi:hypothetical protein
VIVNEGLQVVKDGCLRAFRFYAGYQVFDGGIEGLGDTVCGYSVREAVVKVPPPKSAKGCFYGGRKGLLGCFLLFYEPIYSGPKSFGVHKEIIGKKSSYL